MNNIPKVIHYCWFGRNPLPKSAKKCIKSWKKFLPDYEIKEWNEDNFDVNMITYTKEAYSEKRYAFVSDYVRFYVLYKFGGLYFDTDVEILKPIDDIVEKGSFMGCETVVDDNFPLYVAPGLGLGFVSKHLFLKKMLEIYDKLHFINPDGTPNLKTIVQYTTDILIENGLKKINTIQNVMDINIYPKEYFNPYDCELNKFFITSNTRTIHYYAASWLTKREKFMKYVEKKFGGKAVYIIHKIKMFFSK